GGAPQVGEGDGRTVAQAGEGGVADVVASQVDVAGRRVGGVAVVAARGRHEEQRGAGERSPTGAGDHVTTVSGGGRPAAGRGSMIVTPAWAWPRPPRLAQALRSSTRSTRWAGRGISGSWSSGRGFLGGRPRRRFEVRMRPFRNSWPPQTPHGS